MKVELSKEQIDQVERDTISQARGSNFFKHRAGRIGASCLCGQKAKRMDLLPKWQVFSFGMCQPKTYAK